MSIQSYDVQLAPGATMIIEAAAQIIDFLSSGSAFDQIKVFPDVMQGAVTLKLGQGFDAGATVNRWVVQNPGATAINGAVVLSTAGFRNFRISGDVNVLDGGKSRTLAQSAYAAIKYSGASAGNYSAVALWNPVNSGKRLIVEQITVNGNASNVAGYATFPGIMFSLRIGVVAATFGAQAGPTVLNSKLLGATLAPAAQIWYGSAAASPIGTVFYEGYQLNVGQTIFRPSEPFVILPGTGIGVDATVPNVGVSSSSEWYEEPNT